MTEPEAWVEVAWYLANVSSFVALLTFLYHCLALRSRPNDKEEIEE